MDCGSFCSGLLNTQDCVCGKIKVFGDIWKPDCQIAKLNNSTYEISHLNCNYFDLVFSVCRPHSGNVCHRYAVPSP